MDKRRFKVLLVDDDAEFVGILRELLERNGYAVVPSYSGKEALERAREAQDIDLALVDLVMPLMDAIRSSKS